MFEFPWETLVILNLDLAHLAAKVSNYFLIFNSSSLQQRAHDYVGAGKRDDDATEASLILSQVIIYKRACHCDS